MDAKSLYEEWKQNESTANIADLFVQPIEEYGFVIENADIVDFCEREKAFSLTFNKNSVLFSIQVNALKGTDISGLQKGMHTIFINNLVDVLILIITLNNTYAKSVVFTSGKISEVSSNKHITIKK